MPAKTTSSGSSGIEIIPATSLLKSSGSSTKKVLTTMPTRNDDDSDNSSLPALDEEEQKKQQHLSEHGSSDTGSEGGSSGGRLSSSRSTGASASEDSMDNIEEQLTANKSKAINRLRFSVILMLVLAAIGVSVTVFVLSRKADVEAFEIQYDGNVYKVLDAFQEVWTDKMMAISGLAQDATSHSFDHNSSWPYQTLSNFHGRAGNARKISQALYISLNHLVTSEERSLWEDYVLSDANEWIDQGHEFQKEKGVDNFEDPANIERLRLFPDRKVDPLHYFDQDVGGTPLLEPYQSSQTYIATWETSPILRTGHLNENLIRDEFQAQYLLHAYNNKVAIMSEFFTAPAGTPSSNHSMTAFLATLRSIKEETESRYLGDPISYFAIPVWDTFDNQTKAIKAVMEGVVHWKDYFHEILPPTIEGGITAVLHNNCSGFFTYEIQGDQAFGVGPGDLHDPQYDEYEVTETIDIEYLDDGTSVLLPWDHDECPYTIHIYPTQSYYRAFISGDSVNVTFAVGMVFFYAIILFIFYDRLVESRQRLILAKATKSTAIVASLFPKNVRDRLLKVEQEDLKPSKPGLLGMAPTQRLKTYLGGDKDQVDADSQPIADLFPHCTVFFADIAGFTAWSSTREPAQVFLLLQAVYQAFDILAKRRRVFKVETIGDSYMAVTGLPEPQSNHAVIMARFAWDAFIRFQDVVKELEVSLGPDTGDLGMRFGLHSGPVTAGVLKGDRARFQLFGDTVNTAARMESTGIRNKIQISSTTADLLAAAGKQHWVKPRDDAVKAKGKGVLKTFWLCPTGKGASSATGSETDPSTVFSSNNPLASRHAATELAMRNDRRVDWMVEILLDHIKKIVAVRTSLKKEKETKKSGRSTNSVKSGRSSSVDSTEDSSTLSTDDVSYQPLEGVICLDEVQKALNMHKFNEVAAGAVKNHVQVQIPKDTIAQLREYVAIIAASYKDNPFHNFAHACHVTMSVHKLLQRVQAPDLSPEKFDILQKGGNDLDRELNDFSHGIVHDPMALFAITFSALIHDVDHQGVSNVQLSKEMPDMAEHYRQKSVAEQNSLDVAWDVLMLPKFKELRKCVFETQDELKRFRQLIVNTVLATDIFDKELNDLRKQRWLEAFSEGSSSGEEDEVGDLRATIVIEHIIQASDVSHTMQHWHVYQKWNRSLFKEMYIAYKQGRMGSDPSTFWYKGELGFFDNYIIPLAKKLKECNVFGVSSDEYLNYAKMNRAEWEDRGAGIVEQLIKEVSTMTEEQLSRRKSFAD